MNSFTSWLYPQNSYNLMQNNPGDITKFNRKWNKHCRKSTSLPARLCTCHLVHRLVVRANVITVFFFRRLFFFFYRFALTPCRAPRETSENIDTDLGDAMDRQSLWGIGCIRSSSECIKSYSSMKLVNLGEFRNFLLTQYNSPNRRKTLNKFNVLEISHFLVYVWQKEHGLACVK